MKPIVLLWVVVAALLILFAMRCNIKIGQSPESKHKVTVKVKPCECECESYTPCEKPKAPICISTIIKLIHAGQRDRAKIAELKEEMQICRDQEKINENSIDNLTNDITDNSDITWPFF